MVEREGGENEREGMTTLVVIVVIRVFFVGGEKERGGMTAC